MIDKKTGAIHFPEWSESLSPVTSREKFLRSTLVQNANIQVQNELYCSWWLKPTKWEDGKWWVVVVYFEGEKLIQVRLAASDHEMGRRWDEWSEESEKRLNEYHMELVQRLLGLSYRFPWGNVETSYDEKSGGSFIIITY